MQPALFEATFARWKTSPDTLAGHTEPGPIQLRTISCIQGVRLKSRSVKPLIKIRLEKRQSGLSTEGGDRPDTCKLAGTEAADK